ncbi:MAG: hypothetical protein ACHQ4H_05665 [Ktedonobacterales bacterium]
MQSLAQLGLRAGADGWKAGHAAVRSGTLELVELADAERDAVVQSAAATEARRYMRDAVARLDLTPATGVRLFCVFQRTYVQGALDEALDGGALLR